jgi:hypothetical protein
MSVVAQLEAARVRLGVSFTELSARLVGSGVEIHRSQLSRKLRGLIGMTVREAEAIATVLGVAFAWVPKAAA